MVSDDDILEQYDAAQRAAPLKKLKRGAVAEGGGDPPTPVSRATFAVPEVPSNERLRGGVQKKGGQAPLDENMIEAGLDESFVEVMNKLTPLRGGVCTQRDVMVVLARLADKHRKELNFAYTRQKGLNSEKQDELVSFLTSLGKRMDHVEALHASLIVRTDMLEERLHEAEKLVEEQKGLNFCIISRLRRMESVVPTRLLTRFDPPPLVDPEERCKTPTFDEA